MKYLPREVAFGKLRAMVEATKVLRAEFVLADYAWVLRAKTSGTLTRSKEAKE